MSGRICPDCGVFIRDWRRHLFGVRVINLTTGKVTYEPRCQRQHKRKITKDMKKGMSSRRDMPYSRKVIV